MSLIREMEYAGHDVPAHDEDEVVRQGFMAGIFARNPYPRGTVEHRQWKNGHSLTNKPAAKIKWPGYWLRALIRLIF